MSSDAPFRTPPEELAALTKEIAEVKSVLRDLALRLNQIERHAKRAFGVAPKSTPKQRKSVPRLPVESPTMSTQEALRFFDSLVEASRGPQAETVKQRLELLGPGDLRLVAQELGLPSGTKPAKRALVASILGRIRESIMLSRNVNVTAPRSAQTDPSESSS